MAIKVANNQSLTAITALPSAVSGGAMTLLETQTASSSATLSFTSNIDDTYDEYVFKFYDIHPATDSVKFQFQADMKESERFSSFIIFDIFIHRTNRRFSLCNFNRNYFLVIIKSYYCFSITCRQRSVSID